MNPSGYTLNYNGKPAVIRTSNFTIGHSGGGGGGEGEGEGEGEGKLQCFVLACIVIFLFLVMLQSTLFMIQSRYICLLTCMYSLSSNVVIYQSCFSGENEVSSEA